MIRDRLKSVARKAAIKFFDMEFDTEARDPKNRTKGDASTFDPTKIPKLVDGDGDTPGPNHKEDVGRTVTSAQVVGGTPPFLIDMRRPEEVVSGMLPGAHLLPGPLVKLHLDRLPVDKETARVTVYDQTGEQGSRELALWLRDNGWKFARRLRGGYVEWIEHGEPIVTPAPPAGTSRKVGDPARLKDGREGWILHLDGQGAGLQITVWLSDGSTVGPVVVDALIG
jgi:rhodanese-related sulfurtransferase